MPEKNEYKVHSGKYEHKTQGLNFGYEYTTGNRINENKNSKTKRASQKK